jgi:hypothetical protein
VGCGGPLELLIGMSVPGRTALAGYGGGPQELLSGEHLTARRIQYPAATTISRTKLIVILNKARDFYDTASKSPVENAWGGGG